MKLWLTWYYRTVIKARYINLQVLFSHMDKEKHAIVPGIKMPFLSHTIKHLYSAVSLQKDDERKEKRANRKKED